VSGGGTHTRQSVATRFLRLSPSLPPLLPCLPLQCALPASAGVCWPDSGAGGVAVLGDGGGRGSQGVEEPAQQLSRRIRLGVTGAGVAGLSVTTQEQQQQQRLAECTHAKVFAAHGVNWGRRVRGRGLHVVVAFVLMPLRFT
jgi:hypothetical protein